MKKALTIKVVFCLLIITMTITLLQGFSFAKSENIQMIKKSENEYIIYVSNLLDQDFKFAFSNEENVADKTTLSFKDSALDQEENGNHIAYIDADLYTQYFENKENTYLWVKIDEEYKLSGEKVELSEALSEDEIQSFNLVTKTIEVEVGEKELPKETVNGVEISHKIGTINIKDDKEAVYSYKMVKATSGSEAERLIELAKKMNSLDEGTNIFEQLSVYSEFKDVYTNLIPDENDSNWAMVNDYTIEQPQNSKEGDQYLVWIKQDIQQNSVIDLQIMICDDDYTPEYEKQEVVIKETTKLPKTGDNITLFVIAGIILVLIIAVVVLKVRSKKNTNKNS